MTHARRGARARHDRGRLDRVRPPRVPHRCDGRAARRRPRALGVGDRLAVGVFFAAASLASAPLGRVTERRGPAPSLRAAAAHHRRLPARAGRAGPLAARAARVPGRRRQRQRARAPRRQPAPRPRPAGAPPGSGLRHQAGGHPARHPAVRPRGARHRADGRVAVGVRGVRPRSRLVVDHHRAAHAAGGAARVVRPGAAIGRATCRCP